MPEIEIKADVTNSFLETAAQQARDDHTPADRVDETTAANRRVGGQLVVRRLRRSETLEGVRRRELIERGCRWALPVVVIALWQLAATLEWINTRFFPGPSQIWSAGVSLVSSGRLQEAMLKTSQRMIWGFVFGALIGFSIGAALGTMRSLRKVAEPMVYALWCVPKLAVLPLLLVIFGFGNMPIISLVVLNTMFLIMLPTMAAMAGVSADYTDAARSFEVSRTQMFWHVRLPAALPEVIVAMKVSAGASILVVVAAEFVTGGAGLGYLIWSSWQVLLTDRMYVGIVTCAVIGSLFTLIVAWCGRKVAPWAEDRF